MLDSVAIEEALNQFVPISLDEINTKDYALMIRMDSKYLLHRKYLGDFFEKLRPTYRVLQINDTRLHRYETLYFDTDDYSFYTMHHNKKGTRTKVRLRKYVENGLIFLEVKEKNNKRITSKSRVQVPFFPQSLLELKSLIEQQGIEISEEDLKPQLWTVFRRVTLVNPIVKERLTIDLDLHLKNENQEINCENMIIIELKREKSQSDSPIADMMREWQVREEGFSKYTIGTALINEGVKKNNFKSKLSELNEKFEFEILD